MTEYELRKKFLSINFYTHNKEEVGSMKINLYLISTGPYHQDFLINFKNKKSGRISFDLKLSQII
jgi:hypothetical protein